MTISKTNACHQILLWKNLKSQTNAWYNPRLTNHIRLEIIYLTFCWKCDFGWFWNLINCESWRFGHGFYNETTIADEFISLFLFCHEREKNSTKREMGSAWGRERWEEKAVRERERVGLKKKESKILKSCT